MARKQKTPRARKAAGGAGGVAKLRVIAAEHLAARRYAEAEAALVRLLRQYPADVEGRIARAAALRGQGKRLEALALLREVTASDPACAKAHYRAGLILRDLGRRAEAEFALRDAVAAQPGFAPALIDLGNVLLADGRKEEAMNCLHEAIAAAPDLPVPHYNLGNVLRESGRLAEAVAAYADAIACSPGYADAHFNLALSLRMLGRNEAAAESYRHAASLYKAPARALNNLGTTLRVLRRQDEAAAAFRAAIAADPAYADPYYNLGNSLRASGETSQALELFERCIVLQPDHGLAHVELSRIDSRAGRLAEAEQTLRAARGTAPRDVSILTELAHLVRRQGRVGEAMTLYEDVLRIAPSATEALVYLVTMRQQLCDWRTRDQDFARLTAITRDQLDRGERTSLPAFRALAWPYDEATQLAIARSWTEEIDRDALPQRAAMGFGFARGPRPRLRVGYISQDFRNHALGHLVCSMFAEHDRTAFEIVGYSMRRSDDWYRNVIAEGCDRFVELHDLTDQDAARRIHADGVDILVDMMGLTDMHRLGVLALRPAPLNVTYLQYPGSSGAGFLDYAITDCVVTPDSSIPFYSEKLIRMPQCYQVNNHLEAIRQVPTARAEHGLPETGFVFCCLNNNYKIDPTIFDVWMRLLSQVAGSVLWLMRIDDEVEPNLRREAAARGVDPTRLVFAPKMPKDEHLARQRLADLFIDTRYYTAHTTASDALKAGLPVLTCSGQTFASRVTASILSAVGLPELALPDLAGYEAMALRLAGDPGELRALRDKLAANLKSAPLFDTPRWVRNVERAYRQIWDDYAAGNAPRQVDIADG